MSDMSSIYDTGSAFYDESVDVSAQIPGAAGKAIGALETASPIMNPFLVGGFNQFRQTNTLLYGGFLDNKGARGPFAASRAKFRPFVGNSLTPGARVRSR